MEYKTLNNGVKMPAVGFGTAALPVDEIDSIIRSAYEAGYRMFDTAWHYYNEKKIGNALEGLNISRDEIFITNKLHADNLYLGRPFRRFQIPVRSIRKAFENTLSKLKTDYLDLYLIHWPFQNYEHLWEEIVKLHERGLIKAIGVCSFEPEHLERLKQVSGIVPAVDQFEISPLNTRKPLIEYCKKNGIQVEAFSAFGVGRNKDVVPDIMSDETLAGIAKAHEKTIAQIILRWLVQQDIIVIPRSKNPVRQKENISVFDFELSEEEMGIIDGMNMNHFVYGNPRTAL